VSTLLPTRASHANYENKLRHLGNDLVIVAWVEPGGSYAAQTLQTSPSLALVHVLVRPLRHDLFQVHTLYKQTELVPAWARRNNSKQVGQQHISALHGTVFFFFLLLLLFSIFILISDTGVLSACCFFFSYPQLVLGSALAPYIRQLCLVADVACQQWLQQSRSPHHPHSTFATDTAFGNQEHRCMQIMVSRSTRRARVMHCASLAVLF
jgi:hypothetical protein